MTLLVYKPIIDNKAGFPRLQMHSMLKCLHGIQHNESLDREMATGRATEDDGAALVENLNALNAVVIVNQFIGWHDNADVTLSDLFLFFVNFISADNEKNDSTPHPGLREFLSIFSPRMSVSPHPQPNNAPFADDTGNQIWCKLLFPCYA